ncbi:teleost multiple tissue opsin b [Nothobranchius furzeri]|uniref:Pinopsin-like n=1 Tax=Nothobranchius furzeri TaxID=105023 RepID=A0A1A8A226_NOTFU|nr:teleost multiple tissue opsin b [Nothobranchius furzeri]KAF7214131.1 pinopsin-like [Nothobranchius furzeri]
MVPSRGANFFPAGPNFAAQPGMIVSNVSLSCARCHGQGVSGSLPPLSLSPTGHLVVAVCLGVIGTLGFITNFVVLALFCRYRALRTPMNLLLVSISASDLLVSVLGTPFSFAASTQGRWLIGRAGCVWYGFINACLGIVSLISLAVLSYERYCTMLEPTTADGRDFRPALGGICFSWIYSVAWTVPPLLGWSKYGPEGPGTTCSVDWKTQTPNNISYIISLFTFCLVLPFGVIVYSYGKLLHAIRQVRRVSSVVTRHREQHVLVMVVVMVMCYLVCWLPYGVAALLATFGPPDLLTPEASITPSLLAKCSTVVNPFIYVFMNKQFYRCFRAFFCCSAPQRGSSLKTFSRVTKTFRTVHQGKEIHATVPAPYTPGATPNSIHGSSQGANDVALSSETPAVVDLKPKVILVALYRE